MKKTLVVIGSLFAAIVLMSYSFDNKSVLTCDAPLIGGGHTGAPSETNCATTGGCHTGGVNNGAGITYFDVGGGITQYTPGQTYPVHIKIVQTGIVCVCKGISSRQTIINIFQ